ncbi:MAG: DUF3530 family protein [Pseudomonadota bacterium]
MRYLMLLSAWLLGFNALASDVAREKKWADEVLPSVLVGDPIWLKQADGHAFLGLYTPASPAKAGLVVVHGIGVHPDWGLISGLRQQLPDAGYATLSIQMPILQAEAKSEAYLPLFDQAADRLALAVADLKARGYNQVAIVAHSLGARMTHHYLTRASQPDIAAWVAIGAPAPLDSSKLTLPILDLYGQNDLPAVLGHAATRATGLKHGKSAQVVMPGADHFFAGQEAALVEQVRRWLDATL